MHVAVVALSVHGFCTSLRMAAAHSQHNEPHHPQLAEKRARLADLDGGLIDESRAERDAIFADSRNEYLQEQYGKVLVRVDGLFV